MVALNVILGALSLLFGRKLFWIFVAVAGFLVGMEVAVILAEAQPAWVQLLVGVGLGILGAVIAMFAQRIGFAIAGFYAVGYLAMHIGEAFVPGANLLIWFGVGGILGAIVAALVMDQAIIVLSSLVGAAAIVSVLSLTPLVTFLIFAGLAIFGIAFQSRSLRQSRYGSNSHMQGTA